MLTLTTRFAECLGAGRPAGLRTRSGTLETHAALAQGGALAIAHGRGFACGELPSFQGYLDGFNLARGQCLFRRRRCWPLLVGRVEFGDVYSSRRYLERLCDGVDHA